MACLACGATAMSQPIDNQVRPQRSDQAVPPAGPNTTPPPAAPEPARPPSPSVKQLIGYDIAKQRLGDRMPTGAGIAFGHAEGGPGNYPPGLTGPNYDGVTFTLRSGEATPSGHATTVGRVLYGRRGLVPGVEVVHCMTAGDFLGKLYLNANTTAPPVVKDESNFPPRVFNCSWIGEPGEREAAMILRRLDHQIDTLDHVVCVGVNNGRQTPVPAILASSYNAIAVGTTSGDSSGGYTRVEVEGRCKPDLIAPKGLTSFTTPVVAGCAAMLMEMADRQAEQGETFAGRSEVIKAMLMAGATKPQGWAPAEGKPLDEHAGAGVVNIARSLRIFEGGPAEPGEAIRRTFGWAYPTVTRGGSQSFTIGPKADTGPMSIVAVWNRRIDGRVAMATNNQTGQRFAVWLDGPRLADCDLALYRVSEDGSESLVAESVSRIDNVEHLYIESLSAGDYRIELRRDAEADPLEEDWQVALAWTLDKARPDDADRDEP